MQKPGQLIFIGQAPNRSAQENSKPFEKGYSSTRLSRLLGTSVSQMIEVYSFMSIFDRYPGKGDSNHPRGDHFPLHEARSRANNLLAPLIKNKQVILLGRNVADAFGVSWDRGYFEWIRCSRLECTFSVCPHPSGVNARWNNAKNKQQAEEFFRSLQI